MYALRMTVKVLFTFCAHVKGVGVACKLEALPDKLARKGYQRDAKQCREKLEQLKKKYKKASSRKVCQEKRLPLRKCAVRLLLAVSFDS